MRDWHFIPDNSGHWQYSGDQRPSWTRRRGFTYQRSPKRFTFLAATFVIGMAYIIARVEFGFNI